jgi:cobalt/nickel transport system permease protein
MHPFFPDRYSRLASPIHRLDVSIKFVGLLVLLTGIVLTPLSAWPVYCVIAFFFAVIAFLSRIPPGFLLRRLLVLELLTIGIAILSLLRPDGLRTFFLILTRSTLSLLSILLFSNTTPFDRVLELLRRWHVPALAITLLALMYRYVFLLVDEAGRMRRARASRTFRKQRTIAWFSLSTVVAQLFIRSAERAERTFAAMSARGWR